MPRNEPPEQPAVHRRYISSPDVADLTNYPPGTSVPVPDNEPFPRKPWPLGWLGRRQRQRILTRRRAAIEAARDELFRSNDT